MEHTPGPWIVCYNGNSLLSIASPSLANLIVQAPISDEGLYYQRGSQMAMNFELMASAPELLGALEGAINVIEVILLPGQKWLGMDEATEAIRKAKEA